MESMQSFLADERARKLRREAIALRAGRVRRHHLLRRRTATR
jgi:hypothetical protein